MKKILESPGSDPQAKLFEAIAQINSADEARQFLVDLCTPAELQAMADRWRVVSPLMDEQPYRKINEITGVSMTTIGRVARSITFGEGGYQLIYQRLVKESNE